MSSSRHHFVTQGYLRGFTIADDVSQNFVWVYDKRPGRMPSRKSVKSIAWAPNYYAQERPDGRPDLDTIETKLAQTIDNDIPRLLKQISPPSWTNCCPFSGGEENIGVFYRIVHDTSAKFSRWDQRYV